MRWKRKEGRKEGRAAGLLQHLSRLRLLENILREEAWVMIVGDDREKGSWSKRAKGGKRWWGQIKKERGRERKKERDIWCQFLEINKDFLSLSFSQVDDERRDSPVVSKKWAMGPQISPPPSSLHPVKGIKWRNEGERYDCTLVSPFTKTKRPLWQPWSITVKEPKMGTGLLRGWRGWREWAAPAVTTHYSAKQVLSSPIFQSQQQNADDRSVGYSSLEFPYGKYDNVCHREDQSDLYWWRLATYPLQSESQLVTFSRHSHLKDGNYFSQLPDVYSILSVAVLL